MPFRLLLSNYEIYICLFDTFLWIIYAFQAELKRKTTEPQQLYTEEDLERFPPDLILALTSLEFASTT